MPSPLEVAQNFFHILLITAQDGNCYNLVNSAVLKHLFLERVEQPKISPKNPGNALSDALLMSYFQNFAADAAKNCASRGFNLWINSNWFGAKDSEKLFYSLHFNRVGPHSSLGFTLAQFSQSHGPVKSRTFKWRGEGKRKRQWEMCDGGGENDGINVWSFQDFYTGELLTTGDTNGNRSYRESLTSRDS